MREEERWSRSGSRKRTTTVYIYAKALRVSVAILCQNQSYIKEIIVELTKINVSSSSSDINSAMFFLNFKLGQSLIV